MSGNDGCAPVELADRRDYIHRGTGCLGAREPTSWGGARCKYRRGSADATPGQRLRRRRLKIWPGQRSAQPSAPSAATKTVLEQMQIVRRSRGTFQSYVDRACLPASTAVLTRHDMPRVPTLAHPRTPARRRGGTVFTHPAMASELVRQRRRDLVACADRYRLSRQVNHPSTLWERLRFRASLWQWHLTWRAHGSVLPSGHSDIDDRISRHA